MKQRLTAVVGVLIAVGLVAVPAGGSPAAEPAGGSPTAEQRHLAALDRMMAALAPQNVRASATIKTAYRDHLDLLVLHQFTALEEALGTGGLVPLPPDPVVFNIAPRLDGPNPIGEKDLAHQVSYLTARPATVGALIQVASRVTSGPVEITSLVRHAEYQEMLRTTNANATTSVPMHTMGLAFDIALVDTPLETAREIRDVLLRMRDAGEILFIGERRQLVFHVVPHPSRLGHFAEVYERAQSLPAWWAADHVTTDLTVEVVAALTAPSPASEAVPERPVAPALTAAELVAARLLAVLARITSFIV